MGFEIDAVTMNGAVGVVAQSLAAGRGGWVLTPNLDILRQITTNPEARSLAAATTLRLADGMPLVWASRLKRTPLPERVAGSDLLVPMCERAAADGWSVFLLGGNPGSADDTARTLRARFPALRVAGTRCPPMGFEQDAEYLAAMEAELSALQPRLVFVALGSFKQERLIARLRPVLPGAWFFGIGVTFSFVSGEIARAPHWMRRTGLEWAHRLVQEPRRLARRYLVHGIPFAVKLLFTSAWAGIAPRQRTSTCPEHVPTNAAPTQNPAPMMASNLQTDTDS